MVHFNWIRRLHGGLGTLLLATSALHAQSTVLNVSTVATNPAFSSLGTFGASPIAVTVDDTGNIYAAFNDYTIRKIGTDGTVSLLAGNSGQIGSADGTGSGANFGWVECLAIGPNGNLFECELDGTIREITPAGVVTTIAGASGPPGFADGTGSAARFNQPNGLCVDGAGNIYVADEGNCAIRKVTPQGVVTTIAGQPTVAGYADGSGPAVLFTSPRGVALDSSSGNLYILDVVPVNGANVGAVRVMGPTGTVSTLATGLPAGNWAVAIDATGNLYVADESSVVTEVTPSGGYSIVAGIAGLPGDRNGEGDLAAFSSPRALAVAPNGNVIVADTGNNRLAAGTPVSPFAAAPVFVATPEDSTFTVGQNATLAVQAAGYPAPTFQWAFNGSPIPGATSPTLSLPDVQASDGGTYTVTASSSAGAASFSAVVSVVEPSSYPPATPPTITQEPSSQTVPSGGTATFSIQASSATGQVIYHWTFDGTTIEGATSATLTLTDVTAANAGTYVAYADNGYGVVAQSSPATLAVTQPQVVTAAPAQLVNLSARAFVGAGDKTLAAGFSVSGSANKPLVLRGVGPTLGSYGVADPLATPELTVFASDSSVLSQTTAWGGGSGLSSAMTAVGAFALPADSADAAVEVSYPGGTYTEQVSGSGGSTGVALAEVYDAEPSSGSRLVNLSARAYVGTGANILIAGFVVSGTTQETVLVRGVGPTLASYGISGALPATEIQVFDASGTLLASNKGWGGSAALAATFSQVGAFALPPDSADSALVVTLPAGSYTAELSGPSGETGIGLLELYEVP